MTRSTSAPNDLLEVGRDAEDVSVAESTLPLLRLGVDEADEVEAVLRMLSDLPRTSLPDLARTDDDGVLNERGRAPHEEPSDEPGRRHQADCDEPEPEEALDARVRNTRHLGRHEERERPDRDEMEHTDEVVGSGMVGALLIGVVETVEIRDQAPHGQRHGEDQQLGAVRDVVGARLTCELEQRDEKRARQGDEVCCDERPAHQPSSPPAQDNALSPASRAAPVPAPAAQARAFRKRFRSRNNGRRRDQAFA